MYFETNGIHGSAYEHNSSWRDLSHLMNHSVNTRKDYTFITNF